MTGEKQGTSQPLQWFRTEHHLLVGACWPPLSQQVNTAVGDAGGLPVLCLPFFLSNGFLGHMPSWNISPLMTYEVKRDKQDLWWGMPWKREGRGQWEKSFCPSPSSLLPLAHGWNHSSHHKMLRIEKHSKGRITKDRWDWVLDDTWKPLYQNWVAFLQIFLKKEKNLNKMKQQQKTTTCLSDSSYMY